MCQGSDSKQKRAAHPVGNARHQRGIGEKCFKSEGQITPRHNDNVVVELAVLIMAR